MHGRRWLLAALFASGALRAQATEAVKADEGSGAAPIYAAAIEQLRQAFAPDRGERVEIPRPAEDQLEASLADAAWAAPVERAAAALELFAQAAHVERCAFGASPEQAAARHDALADQLGTLMMLTAAHGRRALADGSLAAAQRDAITLLEHAGHLAAVPSTQGVRISYFAERFGGDLLRRLLLAASGPSTATPRAAALDLQRLDAALAQARRAHRDQRSLGAIAREQALRHFDRTVTTPVAGARDALVAALDRLLAPLHDTGPREPVAVSKRIHAVVAAIRSELGEGQADSSLTPRQRTARAVWELVTSVVLDLDDQLLHEQRAADLLAACEVLLVAAHGPASGAAPIYLAAVEQLRLAMRADRAEVIELPSLPHVIDSTTFLDDAWTEPVQRADAALALFAQAARIERCEFGAATTPFATGYTEAAIPLSQLASLTAAHGRRALAAGALDQARQDAITLLAHARHVAAMPNAIGSVLGYIAEELGAVLTRDVLQAALADKASAPDLQPLAHSFALLQLAHRDRKALAATLRAEALHTMAEALAIAAKGKGTADEDAQGKALREHAETMLLDLGGVLDELLAPLLDAALTEPAAVNAEVKARIERHKGELKQLPPDLEPRQAGRLLAAQWALMVAPGTDTPVLLEHRVADRLAECRALLAKLPPSPGKR